MNLSVSKVLLGATVTGVMVCTMAATAFAAELSAGCGTVTASALKLRAEANTSSACLTLLAKGTAVVVEDASIDGWYKVNYAGETGYLSSEYVSYSEKSDAKLGNGLVTGNSVNIRSAANTSASKVTVLNKGDVVEIIGIDDGWYKISVNGKTGYIRSDYMDVTKKALSSRGNETASAAKASSKGSEIVSFAKKYLGVRYVYGGASAKGFDCSGFTMYVMKNFGYSLPHTATGQWQSGLGTRVWSIGALQPGDLVFFNDPSRNAGKACSHAGIYTGDGQFIHSSSSRSGGVIVSSLTSGYYNTYFVGGIHV